MSKQSWPGPPEGVSSLGPNHERTNVVLPSNRRTSREKAGEDVLQNVHELRSVRDTTGVTPAGVRATSRDVRVGQMPKTRRSRKNTRSFQSVDGRTYTFRSHDQRGNELPNNRLFMTIVALREVGMGGNPNVVFDAWGLNITDMDDQKFYPTPQELLETLAAEDEIRSMTLNEDIDSADDQFALGYEND